MLICQFLMLSIQTVEHALAAILFEQQWTLQITIHCSGNSDNSDSDGCNISDIFVYQNHLDRRSPFIIILSRINENEYD